MELSHEVFHGLPLVGDPVDLLRGHAVLCHHVLAHVELPGELLVTDRTLCFAAVFLHMFSQISSIFVACATDVTAKFDAPCEEERRRA